MPCSQRIERELRDAGYQSDVFVELKDDPDGGAVVSDLEFYDPWPGTPVGVAGSAVLDGSRDTRPLSVAFDYLEVVS